MAKLTELQKVQRKFHFYSWTGAAMLFLVLIIANFVVGFIPLRLDLSDGRVYSITSGSKKLIEQIDDTLLVKVIFSPNLPSPYNLNEKYVSDLLSEYKRASHGKIKIEYLNPSKDPKYREEAIGLGVFPVQLDVQERDRREVKECFMGAVLIYGDKRESLPLIQDTLNLEYEISSRIKKLVSAQRPTVGFVSSGGSQTLADKNFDNLNSVFSQIYDIKTVDLKEIIPPNVKALWMISPSVALDASELETLRGFLRNGGFLGVLVDNFNIEISAFRATPKVSGVDSILSDWGVSVSKGLAVDPRCDRIQLQATRGLFQVVNVIDYQYFPMVIDLDRNHPATKGIDAVVFPFLSPVTISEKKAGFTYTSLGKTSEFSFLDSQVYTVNPHQQKERDASSASGPFDAALFVEGVVQNGTKPARLVVLGTSRFVSSEYPSRPSNYSFFTNLVDWSLQDEALIQIRSKGFSRRPLKEFSNGQRAIIKYSIFVFLPFLSLLIGLFVWRYKKNKRALLPLSYQ